jgi:ATP-dependent Zn protease
MASANTNTATTVQNVNNTTIQASRQICQATCTNVSSGNTVIINGVKIGGNVIFSQQCTADAQCTMVNGTSTTVDNTLQSILKQTAETSWAPDISAQTNISQMTQNVNNAITQIVDSTCVANATNISTNNFTYLTNSTVSGNVSFSQTGDANANCSMTNQSTIQVANDLMAKADQTARQNGFFAGLGAIIAIVVIIIIVVIVFRSMNQGQQNATAAAATANKNAAAAAQASKNVPAAAPVKPPLPPKPAA